MATSTECPDGKYGPDCQDLCGACSGNAQCDKKTGHCPGECEGTVLQPLCKRGCPMGFFGANCDQSCGKCSFFPCDKTSGFCLCPSESGPNGIRDPYQDTCNVCFKGYNPPLCKIILPPSKSTPLAGISLWLVLALFTTLILGIMCFIVIRNRQNRQRAKQEAGLRAGPRGSAPQPLYPESSSAPETSGSFHYAGTGTEATEEDFGSEVSSAYYSHQTF